MGAWSEESFGNDLAADWVYVFLEDPGWAAVSQALDRVLDEEEYLEADAACEALAACEVIARLKGHWGLRDAYTEDLDRWVEENPQPVPPELVAKAEAAIARVVGDASELLELWDEDGRNEAWHSAVDDLEKRVKG
jgi:hypothetical protein